MSDDVDEASGVPSADLTALHAPLAGELEAAARRVLASGRFILGAEVAAFERELAAALGVARAVGISSGTDALLALLMAHGVGPGDEVVTTPLSFFATAGVIARVGARPVFADVEPDTLNLAPDRAIEKLGPRARAIVVVHLFGRAARTAPLAAACTSRGLALIEDAAQAIGATSDGRPVGSVGAAALSFFPSKNLGGFGDGGAVVTDDAALADRVALLRSHGATARMRHELVGGNFRLDELQAALLRVKLPHLSRWTERRRGHARRYRAALANLPGLALPPDDDTCVWNQFVVRVRDGRRDELARALAKRKIATAIYYATPLHLQPALASLGHGAGDFPVAEAAAAEVLALPVAAELDDTAIDRVADAVRQFFP
ncbi:MAG TPA: DegT/DnrJ/EryC1/StrS family aminotransferase [Polyangia bacterium]|nr:DegT/DnrJ/EryC1/StrS family aminotransferase [Polyangia bacterium]